VALAAAGAAALAAGFFAVGFFALALAFLTPRGFAALFFFVARFFMGAHRTAAVRAWSTGDSGFLARAAFATWRARSARRPLRWAPGLACSQAAPEDSVRR